MVRRDWVTVVAVLVVFVVVATGPLTGVDVTSAQATTFGDGDATVDTVDVAVSSLVVTDGRFGSDFSYLRIPTATVSVSSVSDRPRLVYLVSVPALDVDRVTTQVLTEPGTYRLVPKDQALAPTAPDGTHEATLSVRVQSFTTDRTLYRENVTVRKES